MTIQQETERYNPLNPYPGPYGRCSTCGLELPTKQDAADHGRETMEPIPGVTIGVVARGHSVSVTNPPREDRIRREIEMEIESAVGDLLPEIYRLHERYGATLAELTEAVRSIGEIYIVDDWAEYIEDEDGEEIA